MRMTGWPSGLVLRSVLVSFLLSICGFATAHEDATGIVKERMDNFKQSQANLKAIRRLIRDDDMEPIIPLAREISDWAKRIPAYFPEGSGDAPSEADDMIWEDPEGFAEAASRHEEAALALLRLAQAGETETIGHAFKELAATCKTCHQQFRQE